MRLRRILAIVAGTLLGICFVVPRPSKAQITATINGTLTDPSGAAIAGAFVVAQSFASTTKAAETHSGNEGKFTLTLAPGRYGVTISHPSFTRVEEEFTLAAGENRPWEVRLELEKLSASVVVTATAEPTTAESAPVPVDVMTKQDISQREEIWLAPMLETTQGVSLGQTGPYGGLTSIFLDGGNSNFTKVLIDGTPVNDPGGTLDFSNLTLDNIDKIEIVHGASSALYGSDALTGVIQIFTHRGTTTTPQLTLEGDGGSFNTGHGSAQLSGVIGAFDYSGSAGFFSTNGQGANDAFHDTTLSANLGWKFSNTDTLRLTVRNNLSTAETPGQTLLNAPTPGEGNNLQDFEGNLSWDVTINEHWQNHLAGYESLIKDVSANLEFGNFTMKYNRAGVNEQAAYTFPNGALTAGYMFEEETGPAPTRLNQAGYLEARYQIGKRFTAIAGTRAEANGAFGTRVVPRVGGSDAVHYGDGGFWGATRLRASYGLGIKEPEMLAPGCGPDLNPERSSTVDAGVDQYLASDRVHFSATFFSNDFHDIVSFASVTVNPNCPAFGGSFFNTDQAWSRGANTSFEAKATKWLLIVGNYTYDDTRVTEAGSQLTDPSMIVGSRLFRRPLHSARLMANAHFRRMNWNMAGTYVGRRADSDFLSTIVNGMCEGPCITSNPSYVKWDLAYSIELGHGFSTLARVENLFNNHYQDAVGYPALRLNWRAGLRYTWGHE